MSRPTPILILRRLLLALTAIALGHPMVSSTGALRAQAGTTARVIIRLAESPGLRADGAPRLTRGQLDQAASRLAREHAVVTRGGTERFGMLFGEVETSRLEALRNDPGIAFVEVEEPTVLSSADLPPVAPTNASSMRTPADAVADVIPWGVSHINAPQSWASGLTGAGVKVGIIDSGIGPSNDLVVAGGYDFTTQSSSPTALRDNVPSCRAHGTHVAGTVAARQNGSGVVGVAPDVELYSLKVFEHMVFQTNPEGTCAAWPSNQIAALDWAVDNGLRIVNLSIASSTALQAYQNAINDAYAAGVVVVAAAGNGLGNAPITYPAAYDNVIAVGAVNQSNQQASFSNVGPQLWVMAPGVGIVSDSLGSQTMTRDGTSHAAPHVAGVAALHLQENPGWTANQVRTAIRTGAQNLGPAGRDNQTGWGLVRAPVAAAPEPLVLTVAPSSRSASVVLGGNAPNDQAAVQLSGQGASTTAWSATGAKAWNTLTVPSGIGNGTVAWSRNAFGLPVGIHVDTITITVAGATGSPARIIDTLVVTEPPTPLALAVTPGSISVTSMAGSGTLQAQAQVQLTGVGNASASWQATRKKNWTTLTSPSGIGSGIVTWTRALSGLAPGTYVDTITVSAAGANGSPAMVIDTLIVTAPPTPLALEVSPRTRTVLAVTGSAVLTDQATVTLSGNGFQSAQWSAIKRRNWTTLTTASGTGSGVLAWSRATSGLAPGIYVDTITVTAAGAQGSPVNIIDSLVIAPAPVPLAMVVSPLVRSVSVQAGSAAPLDSADVTLSGTGANATSWNATARRPWTHLLTASGQGTGRVRWSRNTNGLGVGTWVDTITVTASGVAGSPARIIDTLVITAAPTPLAMVVSPGSRRTRVTVGAATAPSDSVAVLLSGTGASQVSWQATDGAGHVVLQTSSGTGDGRVRWQRQAAGRAIGVYVDTIIVAATGVGTARVIDTLEVAAPQLTNLVITPRSRHVVVPLNSTPPSDQAGISFIGPDAGLSPWTATSSRPWNTIITGSGTGPGTVRWQRSLAGLAAGIHVDTIWVTAPYSTGSPSMIIDSLEVIDATESLALQLYVRSRWTSVLQGDPPLRDSTRVYLSGPGASSTPWSATNSASWNALEDASGANGETVVWRRNISLLQPGTYVDTILISAPGAGNSPIRFLDSLVVMDPGPFTVAIDPRSVVVHRMPGSGGAGGEVELRFSGLGAATAAWVASSRRAWSTIETPTGVGSGRLRWLRRLDGLPPGTYVDTITVSTAQGAAHLIDSLVIGGSSQTSSLALSRSSSKKRVVRMGGEQTSAGADSVRVQVNGANINGNWVAQSTGAWLQLQSTTGPLPGMVRWNRLTSSLPEGTHVDTLVIALAADPSIRTLYVDTVQVTTVTAPTPDQAADALFRGASVLSSDHQMVLDGTGNRNGRYDLGDFLAWVDRGGILLTGSVRAKVAEAMRLESGPSIEGRP